MSGSENQKPRMKVVQIKGDQDNPLLNRLEAYAKKVGLEMATAARMLLKKALDMEDQKQ